MNNRKTQPMLKYACLIITLFFAGACDVHSAKEKKNEKDSVVPATNSAEAKQDLTAPSIALDTLQFVDFALDKYYNIPSFIDKKGNLINLYTEDTALNNDHLYGKIMEVRSTPGSFAVDDEGDKKEGHQRLMSYKILNVPSYMPYKPILKIMDDIAHLPQIIQSNYKADVYVLSAPNSLLNAYTLRVALSKTNYLHQELFRVYQVPSYRIMHYDQQSEKETPAGEWQLR